MRSRDTDIVIVPGLGGSGPEHWQSRWAARLPHAHRVRQKDWDRPERDGWVGALLEVVAACERPVVLVAHSLGVTSVAQAVATGGLPPVAGAFLAAPPEDARLAELPELDPAFLPTPRAGLPFPALLVASRTDPYASFAHSEGLAADWGASLLDAGEAGHINTASGHGPWPEGLMAFAGFLNRL